LNDLVGGGSVRNGFASALRLSGVAESAKRLRSA
jgi:hypothetical protein